MDWTAIKVITSSEAVEAVSYILTDMGAQGVQIEDAADFANLHEGSMGTTVNLLIHHQFRTEKMAQQYLDISPKTYLFLNYCQLSINE